MRDPKALPRAVLVSALLHIGIVAFLGLAMAPCSFYEGLFRALHLPQGWNPITCSAPLQLKGPVIEATLIGDTGAPPPKPVKHAAPVPTVPPPPSVPPPTPTLKPLPVKTLPPPPEHPDVHDQQKVVAEGLLKAEQQREQEEKQRQRQAELDAAAAKRKQQEQKEEDELFAKMDAAAQATRRAENRAKQAKEQMKDLAKDDGLPDVPAAAQRQTGNNAAQSGLVDQYKAAIQNAVTPNWQHPDNIPDVSCAVHIVQLPGGDVLSAKVEPGCPYDEAGKRSLENAVLRTKTLPYKGFESVFQRDVTLNFRPQ